MDQGTATALASSTIQTLQSTLSGVVPVLYPAGIAVSLLFGGYALIKGWYHRTF